MAACPHLSTPCPNASAGRAFVWIDRQLERASSGPVFLRPQAIAQLVRDSIQRGVQLDIISLVRLCFSR
jgi:hypothetical protein